MSDKRETIDNAVARLPDDDEHQEIILASIAMWWVHRENLRLEWAEYDRRSLFGLRNDPDVPNIERRFAQIRSLEERLASNPPPTLRCARELLVMIQDVLFEREREPDVYLARCDALLPILRNVIHALEHLDLGIALEHG